MEVKRTAEFRLTSTADERLGGLSGQRKLCA